MQLLIDLPDQLICEFLQGEIEIQVLSTCIDQQTSRFLNKLVEQRS